MKKIAYGLTALCLCLTLLPSPARAAEVFEKVNPYSPFSDLSGHWAEPYAKICVETGLMQGADGRFAPEAVLTNAEAAAIAARIREVFTGKPIPPAGFPWYQIYVDYLAGAGITVLAPKAYATRWSFFALLSGVLPDSALTPINSIQRLPDSSDPMVLGFYNAGILTGTDRYGTFEGAAPLTRAQCAAMVARIADPALRKRFTPAGQVPAAPYADEALVLTVDGAPITFASFRDVLVSLTGEVMELYNHYDLSFSWEGGYGVDSWNQVLRETAKHSLIAQTLVEQKANQLGCPPGELALALFGPPTQQELNVYALEQDLNRNSPGVDQLLTDRILEEKLNAQIILWVEQAQIVTTPIYDSILPQELWTLYGGY